MSITSSQRSKSLTLLILLMLVWVRPAAAQTVLRPVVAVVELQLQTRALDPAEVEFLTDAVRRVTGDVLDPQSYTLLSKETMDVLMPPEERLACQESMCLAEFGRQLQAAYVIGGTVSDFDGRIALTLACYETRQGELMGSAQATATGPSELLVRIEVLTPQILKRLSMSASGKQRLASGEVASSAPSNPRPAETGKEGRGSSPARASAPASAPTSAPATAPASAPTAAPASAAASAPAASSSPAADPAQGAAGPTPPPPGKAAGDPAPSVASLPPGGSAPPGGTSGPSSAPAPVDTPAGTAAPARVSSPTREEVASADPQPGGGISLGASQETLVVDPVARRRQTLGRSLIGVGLGWLVAGATLDKVGDNAYLKYLEVPAGSPQSQFDEAYSSARSLYILRGVALGLGVGLTVGGSTSWYVGYQALYTPEQ